MTSSRAAAYALPAATAVAAGAYAAAVRPWMRDWGASYDELVAELPGDDIVAADRQETHAISIAAAPSAVWPWLVQMAQDRAGIGPLEPLGWRVEHLEPERSLVLRGDAPVRSSWALVLRPAEGGATRLVSRWRWRTHRSGAAVRAVTFEPAHFVMETGVLHGIRDRAETLNPLLDELMPEPDARRVERLVVEASAARAWEAVLGTDLMRLPEVSRPVQTLFSLRAIAERAVCALRRRPPSPPMDAPSLRLADLPAEGEWIRLAERPGSEIAFGAIGRFWAGETVWDPIDAATFRDGTPAQRVRLACSVSVRPAGAGRVQLAYECRSQATDEAARRAFLRYWRVSSPFIGMVLRATLRLLAAEARR